MRSRERIDIAIVRALVDRDSALYKSCGDAAELVASLAEEVETLRSSIAAISAQAIRQGRVSSTATPLPESTETI